MAQSNLIQLLQSGTAPKPLRMLIARGSVPIPTKDLLEPLLLLLKDTDPEIASCAKRTAADLDRNEIAGYLRLQDCSPDVLEYFATSDTTDPVLHAIIENPASPGKTIERLALSVPVHLLEKILDNRTRILEFPKILENINNNPEATPEIRRLVLEIQSEFFGGKKKEYALEETAELPDSQDPLEQILEVESEIPLEDLSLEGLPVDSEARQTELLKRISCLSVRQKVQYAMFGTREIRAIMVRDTNKEVARSALRSPKITENEVESIAAMRGVSEDVLREIGNSKQWTRNYIVIQNLVRNPKTPLAISQRLLFRLHNKDLSMLSRDRSVPDAVRQNATRTFNQRTRTSQ
jgi:hypothetical protein